MSESFREKSADRDRAFPLTKTARQARIAVMLSEQSVHSQAELASLLEADGMRVAQATLSRDLVELGAMRVRRNAGFVYALPDDEGEIPEFSTRESWKARLNQLCVDLLIAAEAAANVVVIKTPPGAANFLAMAIDHAALPAVLGCVAGDDTVMVVVRDAEAARVLAKDLIQRGGSSKGTYE